MPGVYREGAWDIAGTLVGVVERSRILGPERVREGDALLALPSGPHTNGYSSSARWWRARTSPPPSPNSAKALKKPSSAPTGPT